MCSCQPAPLQVILDVAGYIPVQWDGLCGSKGFACGRDLGCDQLHVLFYFSSQR